MPVRSRILGREGSISGRGHPRGGPAGRRRPASRPAGLPPRPPERRPATPGPDRPVRYGQLSVVASIPPCRHGRLRPLGHVLSNPVRAISRPGFPGQPGHGQGSGKLPGVAGLPATRPPPARAPQAAQSRRGVRRRTGLPRLRRSTGLHAPCEQPGHPLWKTDIHYLGTSLARSMARATQDRPNSL